MKKFKTMMAMMLALVSMCVAFSSCSSDDDDNNGAGSSATAEQVVGTYVGETMSIALAGQGDMDLSLIHIFPGQATDFLVPKHYFQRTCYHDFLCLIR